jgi:hypothetical protein
MEKELREILERLYAEGTFEGEHQELHPDRIAPSLIDIIKIFEKEIDNMIKESVPDYDYLNDKGKGYKAFARELKYKLSHIKSNLYFEIDQNENEE